MDKAVNSSQTGKLMQYKEHSGAEHIPAISWIRKQLFAGRRSVTFMMNALRGLVWCHLGYKEQEAQA